MKIDWLITNQKKFYSVKASSVQERMIFPLLSISLLSNPFDSIVQPISEEITFHCGSEIIKHHVIFCYYIDFIRYNDFALIYVLIMEIG